MMNYSEKSKAECGAEAVEARAARSLFASHSSFVIRHSRVGLTLIELLVTIVIMVTVLAGVLPLVSPNNNSRKIREASRQLNTFLSQAQAQAARDGRPAGIAFREAPGGSGLSGMATEVYTLAEPAPFAGFSENSRVHIQPTGRKYGDDFPTSGDPEPMFPKLRQRNLDVFRLFFVSAGVDPLNPPADPLPPNTIRIGDTIEILGNRFMVIDDVDRTSAPNQTVNPSDESNTYLVDTSELDCVYLNSNGQAWPTPAGGGPILRPYVINRQPINTADQPLQFPRGIGIDLQSSGSEGFSVPFSLDNGGPTTIGLMFSPNGSIDALYRNGVKMDGVEKVFFLLGLIENGNDSSNGQDPNDYDFAAGGVDNDTLLQRRGRINWLNTDSRWVSVNHSGRIVTTTNNVSFDPRVSPYIDDPDIDAQRVAQMTAARQNASNMTSTTGQ